MKDTCVAFVRGGEEWLLVTANADGSIPLNSKVLAEVKGIHPDNAASIVRAVNAHEELLAACKRYLRALDAAEAVMDDTALTPDWVEMMRAAVKKAEAK